MSLVCLCALQIQKLKGLMAKQNVSLKALEREKQAQLAHPVRFEVAHEVPEIDIFLNSQAHTACRRLGV